jgi:hypothetical protein
MSEKYTIKKVPKKEKSSDVEFSDEITQMNKMKEFYDSRL